MPLRSLEIGVLLTRGVGVGILSMPREAFMVHQAWMSLPRVWLGKQPRFDAFMVVGDKSALIYVVGDKFVSICVVGGGAIAVCAMTW
ncbi:hypothetical protein DEO72_LG7g904 [Vigna unguiculata]|uniref:Uncharacterized protein n=1 Tax=Vigna unguiculata TaxID=3917 RepID=A0A4D6MFU2_VIGUN|nr:hypothetical protein DEO72_LG7g904 [Vigna unguiculata]